MRHAEVVSTFHPDDPTDPGNPENRDWTRVTKNELRRRLLVWDPIGVASVPQAQDEYDCMLSPLLHQLHDAATAAEIAAWVVGELESHFGLAADPARERRLGVELVEWWRDRTTP